MSTSATQGGHNKWLRYRGGTARRPKSVEILSATAQLYEKITFDYKDGPFMWYNKISPVGFLDQSESTRVTDGQTDRITTPDTAL